MTPANAKRILILSEACYPRQWTEGKFVINMNDTWGWATAWGVEIPEDKLVEVAGLLVAYGHCGLLYWVSEQNEQMRSEFEDINRFVDFVRREEQLRKDVPNSSKRAYKKISYTLGLAKGAFVEYFRPVVRLWRWLRGVDRTEVPK